VPDDRGFVGVEISDLHIRRGQVGIVLDLYFVCRRVGLVRIGQQDERVGVVTVKGERIPGGVGQARGIEGELLTVVGAQGGLLEGEGALFDARSRSIGVGVDLIAAGDSQDVGSYRGGFVLEGVVARLSGVQGFFGEGHFKDRLVGYSHRVGEDRGVPGRIGEDGHGRGGQVIGNPFLCEGGKICQGGGPGTLVRFLLKEDQVFIVGCSRVPVIRAARMPLVHHPENSIGDFINKIGVRRCSRTRIQTGDIQICYTVGVVGLVVPEDKEGDVGVTPRP